MESRVCVNKIERAKTQNVWNCNTHEGAYSHSNSIRCMKYARIDAFTYTYQRYTSSKHYCSSVISSQRLLYSFFLCSNKEDSSRRTKQSKLCPFFSFLPCLSNEPKIGSNETFILSFRFMIHIIGRTIILLFGFVAYSLRLIRSNNGDFECRRIESNETRTHTHTELSS